MPMIRTRWYKVLLDLWGNRGRTLVVALAIAVGVYAVGVIVDTQELLLREHGSDQAEALIAAATVRTTPFDSDLAERVAQIESVTAAEGRHVANVYAYDARGNRKDIQITAVPDFELIRPIGQGPQIGSSASPVNIKFSLRQPPPQSETRAQSAH